MYYSPNELRGGLPGLLPHAEPDSGLILDYGWLCDGGQLLVEHKTLGDLAQSLRIGHLVGQLERAKGETSHVYLFVTGFPTQGSLSLTSGRWVYKEFQNALLSTLHGLQVGGPIIGATLSATAVNLMALYTQSRRETLGRGRPVLSKWKTTEKFDQVESYARALPGIGWVRAAALYVKYPTWGELASTLAVDGAAVLLGIPGFGPKACDRVWGMVMGGHYVK